MTQILQKQKLYNTPLSLHQNCTMHTVHRLGLWQSCIHLKDHTQNLSLWVFKQIVAIQLTIKKLHGLFLRYH